MRLIDGDDFQKRIEQLCDALCEYSKKQRLFMCSACKLGNVLDVIDDAPTVDAVPVVKCRDCKHHHYEKHFDKRIPYCDRINYGYGWQDNDFCSRGERKDGEQA